MKPIAWIDKNTGKPRMEGFIQTDHDIPLYTHPIKELTLTTDEIFDVWDEHTDYDGNFVTSIDDFVKAILRKAQEK